MKVVYSASRNLYPYLLPSITSLLEHNKAKVYLLIEDDSLPYDIPEECEIINVSEQTIFPQDGVNFRSQFTYLALMRAAYTKLLKEDKVLQLDVDTIITGDLSELWKTRLTNKWFAACQETQSRYKPFGPKYYNVGVALFNLKQIRKDKIDDEVINILNTQPLRFLDQDAWNGYGLHYDKIVDLESKYNCCFATDPTDEPLIVHYAGWPNWMHDRDIPNIKYLLRYKHLYRE